MSIKRTIFSVKTLIGLSVGLFSLSAPVLAEYGLNFQQPATQIAQEVYDLHMLIFYVCLTIMVLVFGVMIYSLIMHRKSRGFKAASFHESSVVEVVWTVIPFFILVAMAIPSTATLIKMEETADSDMSIKVTGYQWKWEYEYMDSGVSFFSTLSTPREQINNKAAKGEHYLLEVDKRLIIPINKKVRFLLTSNDVLHAWWVPAFGVKKDAIPGYINEIWAKVDKPGVYRGQCAELCGRDHGFMPIVVEAVSQEDYDTWIAQQDQHQVAAAAEDDRNWTRTELMAKGHEVYNSSCAACHGGDGQGVPGAFPAIAASKVATGAIEDHIKIVKYGKTGTAMSAFGKQLSDSDIAAVITYQRNSFGNQVGDSLQPSQIKAYQQ